MANVLHIMKKMGGDKCDIDLTATARRSIRTTFDFKGRRH